MNAVVVILKAGQPNRSRMHRLRQGGQRDACMSAIGRLSAAARSHGERVEVCKRVVRYGAIALCHALGLRLAAAFLSSLAGQITAEADAAGAP